MTREQLIGACHRLHTDIVVLELAEMPRAERRQKIDAKRDELARYVAELKTQGQGGDVEQYAQRERLEMRVFELRTEIVAAPARFADPRELEYCLGSLKTELAKAQAQLAPLHRTPVQKLDAQKEKNDVRRWEAEAAARSVTIKSDLEAMLITVGPAAEFARRGLTIMAKRGEGK